MKLSIRFFSTYKDVTGVDTLVVERPGRASVEDLLEYILEQYPGLKRFRKGALIAVNKEFSDLEYELSDGDEVAFMPPVGGG